MNMSRLNTNILIQLFGMMGVICSLIFVGLEMRQSQSIALVNQMQQRSYSASATINSSTEANLDWYSHQFNVEYNSEFSTEDKAVRNILNVNWFIYEADYFQYTQGLMTEEVWQAKLRGIAINLKRCDNQEIYQKRVGLVEEGFKIILENIPFQCEKSL
jgi:hypothetical protein|tara:strand:- start:108 stop:584 length:477 start_codon:yes stop_codon:yes gene_type:complete